MKNGVNPTRKQKQIIEQNRLNPANWLIVKAPPKELHIVHRWTGNKKVISL